MVDATGSMPARTPLYRTSEWEMREMGFLETCRQHMCVRRGESRTYPMKLAAMVMMKER